MTNGKEPYWLFNNSGMVSQSCELMTPAEAERRNEWAGKYASPTIQWLNAMEIEKLEKSGSNL